MYLSESYVWTFRLALSKSLLRYTLLRKSQLINNWCDSAVLNMIFPLSMVLRADYILPASCTLFYNPCLSSIACVLCSKVCFRPRHCSFPATICDQHVVITFAASFPYWQEYGALLRSRSCHYHASQLALQKSMIVLSITHLYTYNGYFSFSS